MLLSVMSDTGILLSEMLLMELHYVNVRIWPKKGSNPWLVDHSKNISCPDCLATSWTSYLDNSKQTLVNRIAMKLCVFLLTT